MLVLEKEIFPRFHIGESLLPIDLPIFERLGVVLDYKDFIRKDGAEFIDERTGATATFVFREGLNGTPQNAYQVERSRFDHRLLKQAEARGAKVRYGVKVEDMTVEADHVRVDTTAGVFRARYMVDATGQDAFLARANRTVQPLKGFGCIAVFRHYDGIAPEIFAELTESGNIKVLMVPDGWMWLIPLAGPRLSVGIVSRHPMSAPFETLDKAIAASPITQRLIAGAAGTEPRIIRNFSYRNRRPYGPRWGCAGDASCFSIRCSRPACRWRCWRESRWPASCRPRCAPAPKTTRSCSPSTRSGWRSATRPSRESCTASITQSWSTGCSSRTRRASRCVPGSPASSARTSGATTIRSSRCC